MVALHAVKSLSWNYMSQNSFTSTFQVSRAQEKIVWVLGSKKEVLSHCLFSESWCRAGAVAAQAHYLPYAGCSWHVAIVLSVSASCYWTASFGISKSWPGVCADSLVKAPIYPAAHPHHHDLRWHESKTRVLFCPCQFQFVHSCPYSISIFALPNDGVQHTIS